MFPVDLAPGLVETSGAGCSRRLGLGELMQRIASSSTFECKADDPGGTGRWLLERDGLGLTGCCHGYGVVPAGGV